MPIGPLSVTGCGGFSAFILSPHLHDPHPAIRIGGRAEFEAIALACGVILCRYVLRCGRVALLSEALAARHGHGYGGGQKKKWKKRAHVCSQPETPPP